MRAISITTRISMLFSALAVLVLGVMGYVISMSVAHHFEMQDRMALEGKLALLQNILDEPVSMESNANAIIKGKLADALVGHHELVVAVVSAAGEPVFSSAHGAVPADYFAQSSEYDGDQSIPLVELAVEKHRYRAAIVSMSAHSQGKKYQVFLAIDRSIHDAFLENFHWQLLGVGGVGLSLIIVFAWVVTRQGLRPVVTMAQVVEGISAQKIKERLSITHLPAELRSLGISFNGMLDRLEEALARLSDFSSDIAHELRTPINNLMTQTQVSLSKDRSADEYREVLFSNMEEYERLARMIADMLFLAKADNGQIVPHLETIALRQEVEALFEFYDALAAEKHLQLECKGNASLSGDRLMLRRALSNLLSNAIRHANSDSRIEVALSQDNALITLAITNTGDVIAPEVLSRIFERFYRADASRFRVDEGAGLGLAITRSIVKAHRGEILAQSTEGITRFVVSLPVFAPANDVP